MERWAPDESWPPATDLGQDFVAKKVTVEARIAIAWIIDPADAVRAKVIQQQAPIPRHERSDENTLPEAAVTPHRQQAAT